MATELSHRGFSTWISVNGDPVPVYNIQTEGSRCTGWIPSEVGKHFSVCWKNKSGDRIATSGHVFVDGRDVASAIMRPGRSIPVERAGMKTSSRRIKPFKFSVLTLTDDDSVADIHDPSLEHMGTIRLEISQVKLGSEIQFKGYRAEEHCAVHEKAKKLGAHCTSFGPGQRTDSTRTVAITTIPYDENRPGPYLTFVFIYRSPGLAMGIFNEGKAQSLTGISNEIVVISDSEDEDQEPVRKRPRLSSSNERKPKQPEERHPELSNNEVSPENGENRRENQQQEDIHEFPRMRNPERKEPRTEGHNPGVYSLICCEKTNSQPVTTMDTPSSSKTNLTWGSIGTAFGFIAFDALISRAARGGFNTMCSTTWLSWINPPECIRDKEYLFPAILIAMLVSTIPISIIATSFIMSVKPLWKPDEYIPIVGMLAGASISSIIIAVNDIMKEFHENRDRVETYLAFGASRLEVAIPIAQQALQLALMPPVNQMSVLGIISIPGMMTGAILGGSSVEQAAKLQSEVVIMFCISASTALASIVSATSSLFILIDRQHRVRPDRLDAREHIIWRTRDNIIQRVASAFKRLLKKSQHSSRPSGSREERQGLLEGPSS
ncbi:hypothetical protein Clacol_002567 [Clathrus columnatus]|uniref:DUF7918 domain-containing protein n=1 Tax=Clathrus columnatus TaxID=1419009 RepID=A0AAV5A6T4_9AGAM|nr:hypothetical protein Clacol_002567 [Clathrus columnatus]